ncbi:hypothetical protein HMPREF1583_01176, partial [Gardnerella vaginalis JCP8151B]
MLYSHSVTQKLQNREIALAQFNLAAHRSRGLSARTSSLAL